MKDQHARSCGVPRRRRAPASPGCSSAATRCGSPARSCPNSVEAIVPTSGWRIYTIGSSIPRRRPGRVPADDRRRGRAAGRRTRSPTFARCPRAEQVSDFHCVTGWTRRQRPVGGRPVPRPPRRGRRPAEREGAAVRLGRGALRRHAHAAAGLRARRAARARHGRRAALASRTAAPSRVVMPRMYGYKSVKWVTRIEVRTTYDDLGYWEQRGYDEDAWIGALERVS